MDEQEHNDPQMNHSEDDSATAEALSSEDLLRAGDEEIRVYRHELARQLNEGVDALGATFDEALPMARTIHQSRRGLGRLARYAKQRSQRFEWWWFVTDGGRLKPRTRLGRLWFEWQYRLFAFRRARQGARDRRRAR